MVADNPTKLCEHCGTPRNSWAQRFCSNACFHAAHQRTAAERFWPKVEKTSWCWLWRGSLNAQGYGNFRHRGRTRLANRVVYELTTGQIPPDRFDVCHRCDVPACVNPDHLFLGTRADNVNDMLQKGRGNAARGDRSGSRKHPERLRRGETSGMAKLTDDAVRLIRAEREAGVTLVELARRLNVSHRTVCAVAKRQSWKHVV